MKELTDLQRWVSIIAAMTPDQECLEHGAECTEDACGDDCEMFDMTNDDAVETLNNLITEARVYTAEWEV